MGEDKAISADYFLISSELTACSSPTLTLTTAGERRLRPPQEEPLRCPRCDSANTKFCYYNNYSLSQPRYFCKSCRRYWTKGGSLRNVPVGGGCRRNKRYRTPASAAVSAATTVQQHRAPPALPLADLKQVQLPNYSTSNGSLNIMDYCSYNSNGLNRVMNNCKHGLGDMNTLGLCMDGSRETLMEDPCQKLKFFLDDECIDPGMKPGEGSWNNILSVGWQESIGYSDDHGSLSSSWARR